jgi:hypothetical protein
MRLLEGMHTGGRLWTPFVDASRGRRGLEEQVSGGHGKFGESESISR